jgi:hypothetical protein
MYDLEVSAVTDVIEPSLVTSCINPVQETNCSQTLLCLQHLQSPVTFSDGGDSVSETLDFCSQLTWLATHRIL